MQNSGITLHCAFLTLHFFCGGELVEETNQGFASLSP